ncbi:MAG: magnesium transporter [Elusimicrobia bacterium RIFCSPLOWO2_01_FULL_59_12]|nr:MAG: magnesium transporter [Elusimicrobia bacterium RIFCSPLOWO2_01_FULL_59_12]
MAKQTAETINLCQLLIPEIKQLIQEKNLADLQKLLTEINPIDLAEALPQFPPEHRLLLLRLLKPAELITVFEELDPPEQQFILEHLEDATITPLIEGIPAQNIAALLNKLPKTIVRRMSKLMSDQRIHTVAMLPIFPKGTAGAAMRADLISITADMTAKAALERLRANLRVRKNMNIQTVYVTFDGGRIAGMLPLQTLISAPPDIRLRDILHTVSGIKVPGTMDQEEAAKLFTKYKLTSAPVVDPDDRLIGVLTLDQILQVVQEEATEDIQKLGAVEALDEPYFDIRFSKMIRKRGAWLGVLFLGELLTASVMGFFEKEIAQALVLVLFIPLIISSGGNSGSQAATLVVRALALREVTLKDWWRVVQREFLSGLALGGILGGVGFLRIYLWSQFSPVYGPHYLLVAVTVGLTLVLIVMWGTLAGSTLPIFLRRFGLDPAVASAPFVATLVDVTGIVIYFATAALLLKGTLL